MACPVLKLLKIFLHLGLSLEVIMKSSAIFGSLSETLATFGEEISRILLKKVGRPMGGLFSQNLSQKTNSLCRIKATCGYVCDVLLNQLLAVKNLCIIIINHYNYVDSILTSAKRSKRAKQPNAILISILQLFKLFTEFWQVHHYLPLSFLSFSL